MTGDEEAGTEPPIEVAGAPPVGVTAGLVQTVLDAEAERELLQAEDVKQVLFADDLLPGVGEAEISLSQGLATAGRATFVVCVLLFSLDQLQSAALSVLAPNIRDGLHVSNGTIVFISAASGSFQVVGALPMGWLADRLRRGRIMAWAGLIFAAMVFISGLAVNAFTFFCARFGVGMAQSSNGPVSGSLLADAYPIGVRGRMGAANGFITGALGAIGPVLVGGIATIIGGGNGWRWALIALAVPVAVVAVFAFRLPEPPRGQYEMRHVLGEVLEHHKAAPISIEAAFSRLLQIRTLKTAILAFSALGFGLFTIPVLSNLFMENHYHLDAFRRGLVGTIGSVGSLVALPFAGKYYDRLYRRDPARALRLIGLMIMPAALLAPVQYFMPNIVAFTAVGVPGSILLLTSFFMVGPMLQSIVPYRLRALGGALGSIYIFFVGATGGALLSSLLTSAFGVRTAILTVLIPSTLIGGILLFRSAGFVRQDLSLVVAELREEMDEQERQQADPDRVPVVQVNHIDFSYGQVQILFDVSCEVRRGEVLALLGTNGAGKSTILRVIAGLGTPSRGVVRFNGTNITYVSPEQRTRMGIQLLPGGKGVFPDITVRENLEMGSFIYRGQPADRERRIQRVFELFPSLVQRRDALAGSMSGGEQQMLALGRVLLHEPEVLIIDELSLGLAPIIVQELIAIVERLRDSGVTMIVVEQSLNVAASISDRAVFLEKGRVLFDGPTKDLIERDDLARAVFLGSEGG